MRASSFHYRFTFCALLLTVNLFGDYPLLAAEPTAVKTVKPEIVLLERKTTRPASVHAYHNVDVYARVSGYAKQVNVDIGDVVKADQPLAKIDVPEMIAGEKQQLAEIVQLKSDIGTKRWRHWLKRKSPLPRQTSKNQTPKLPATRSNTIASEN